MIGVLHPLRPGGQLGAPDAVPLGRAGLALAGRIQLIIGENIEDGVMRGYKATADRWKPVEAPLSAAWDRFPSQSRPDAYAALLAGLGDVPLGNPPSLNTLCRDKVASQRQLEQGGVPMPELVVESADFAAALACWPEGGFLKPRHGSFGRGVRYVVAGDRLNAEGEGAVPGQTDNLVLQRAVPPPPGWAGVSVRQLVQRVDGGWVVPTAAVRRHRRQRVVNVARNAEVAASVDVLAEHTRARMAEQATAAARVLGDHPHAIELGLDFVVDPGGEPWLIEVNARPRGHLAVLARADPARFKGESEEAWRRPLTWLAALGSTPPN